MDDATNAALQAKNDQHAEALADVFARLPLDHGEAFLEAIDQIKATRGTDTETFRLSATMARMMADLAEFGFNVVGLIAQRRQLEKEANHATQNDSDAPR